MRATAVLVSSVGLIVSMSASPAWAQRVPVPGMWGVGGSVGASVPSDASLNNGIELSGNVEKYLTSRVSIRGQFGGAWNDITGRHFTGTINPVFLDGNVVYNWEGGNVHPFVTGGVGVYRFHSSESGFEASDTKAGFDVGGGFELFFSRRATMTTELLYHKVGAFNSPLTTFNDGSFWRFGVGVKRYF